MRYTSSVLRVSVILLALPLFAVLGAAGVAADQSVTSANLHKITSCTMTTPPLSTVGNDADVHANAYHVNSACQVSTALAFPSYTKPKIISDDAGGFTITDVLAWIDQVAAAGEHYEHFDAALTNSGVMKGLVINGPEDFPMDSKTVMTRLGQYATPLTPNGKLSVTSTEFKWNGANVTLMGSSWMGSLVGYNFDVNGYLDVLKSYNVNLTRVWAIEQWTALAVDCTLNMSCTYDADGNGTLDIIPTNGVTPFSGTFQSKWNLNTLNNAFFTRARQFVQAAADRGIVVQFTLFDRHGLLNNAGEFARWLGSPYNAARNVNGFLPSGASGAAPNEFTGLAGTNIGNANSAFIARAVRELGSYGNVIFEIMNEPLASEWSDAAVTTAAWHQWVADRLRIEFAARKTVFVDLKATDYVDGLNRPPTEPTDGDTVSMGNKSGRHCRKNSDPLTDHYVYFRVADTFGFQGSQPTAYVTVNYFDEGTGYLQLQYDGTANAYTGAATVTLGNTLLWKSYTWSLSDAYFGNRQNQASDFRIFRSNNATMYLDLVRVSN